MSGFLAIPLLLAVVASDDFGRNDFVEALITQANARIAAGEAPTTVEASLTQSLSNQGAKIEQEPPSWDVYAKAHWERNQEAFNVTVEPQRIDPNEQAPSLLRPAARPASQNDNLSGRAGRDAPAPGSAPVVHFSDARRLDAQSAADLETRVPNPRQSQPT